MSRIVFPPILSAAVVPLVWDYTSRLQTAGGVTDTLSSATVSVAVYSGTDPTPSAILSGSATVSGNLVTQKVTGGVVGTTYLLTCSAATTQSAASILTALLTIIPGTL